MGRPREDALDVEDSLLATAEDQLARLLGPAWKITPSEGRLTASAPDAIWQVRPPGEERPVTMLVEVKASKVTPRTSQKVAHFLEHAKDSLNLSDVTALIVTPYLSPRTRALLDDQNINYIDATGNVSIRLDNPLVFIKTEGAQRDPAPAQPQRGISGARAGKLVRELVDRRPPRRGHELAEATNLSEGYVSRLLDAFAEEALIQRRQRVIVEVDWQGLLRARSATFDLMKANHVVPTVARFGTQRSLTRLRELNTRNILATGAFAANQFAPLAVGGAVMLYAPTEPSALKQAVKDLALMRVDDRANADILFLQPMNDIPFIRPHPIDFDGLWAAGLSQVALDCLAGPGRLPAAGEELIDWMARSEDRWRGDSPLVSVS